jgi:hypothetical protein
MIAHVTVLMREPLHQPVPWSEIPADGFCLFCRGASSCSEDSNADTEGKSNSRVTWPSPSASTSESVFPSTPPRSYPYSMSAKKKEWSEGQIRKTYTGRWHISFRFLLLSFLPCLGLVLFIDYTHLQTIIFSKRSSRL